VNLTVPATGTLGIQGEHVGCGVIIAAVIHIEEQMENGQSTVHHLWGKQASDADRIFEPTTTEPRQPPLEER
jgi:hypothetical protein